MSTYQTLVSEAVKRYMSEAPASQSVIAEVLQISQPAVSKKLAGIYSWTLSDVERLHAALGIEFPLPALVGAK